MIETQVEVIVESIIDDLVHYEKENKSLEYCINKLRHFLIKVKLDRLTKNIDTPEYITYERETK